MACMSWLGLKGGGGLGGLLSQHFKGRLGFLAMVSKKLCV